MTASRNDTGAPLTKFCLSVEEHRRTTEGRVRTPQQFSSHFFTPKETGPEDRLFKHLPKEVRGPIIAAWGIRGAKAAVRDTDEKVAAVVSDAIIAGDLAAGDLEEGLSPGVVISWLPLAEWWAFWRGGVLTKAAAQKALVTAYELGLFDAAWMFDNLEAKGGAQKGTLVVSDGLSKDDLVEWVRRIHESRDGTPKGLLEAMGWDKLVAKTANEALFGLLDALAKKVGLVAEPELESKTDPPPAGEVPPPPVDVPPPAPTLQAAPPALPSDPDLAETGPYALPGTPVEETQQRFLTARSQNKPSRPNR